MFVYWFWNLSLLLNKSDNKKMNNVFSTITELEIYLTQSRNSMWSKKKAQKRSSAHTRNPLCLVVFQKHEKLQHCFTERCTTRFYYDSFSVNGLFLTCTEDAGLFMVLFREDRCNISVSLSICWSLFECLNSGPSCAALRAWNWKTRLVNFTEGESLGESPICDSALSLISSDQGVRKIHANERKITGVDWKKPGHAESA